MSQQSRINKIKGKYGKTAFERWGKRGGNPVILDKEAVAFHYRRHPKKK